LLVAGHISGGVRHELRRVALSKSLVNRAARRRAPKMARMGLFSLEFQIPCSMFQGNSNGQDENLLKRITSHKSRVTALLGNQQKRSVFS